MKLSPRLAGAVSGLWAVVVGASTQIPNMPWWGHYAIVAGGVLLSAYGINTATTPAESAAETGPWT